MAEPRKIIIDTDPGQDDAAAIMLAFGSPDELEVLGITTVAGNVPLSLTSRNARIVSLSSTSAAEICATERDSKSRHAATQRG